MQQQQNVEFPKELEATIKQHKQENLIEMFKQIKNAEQQHKFLNNLKEVDFKLIEKLYKQVNKEIQIHNIEPCKQFTNIKDLQSNDQAQLKDIGYQLIRDKHVGIILMAGGSGSRLKYAKAKGTFQFNLPSNKSIFQLHSEKILKIMDLTYHKYDIKQKKYDLITFYIMTSSKNDKEIKQFFKDHNFFGLNQENIVFFRQGFLPAVSNDSKILFKKFGKITKEPNGNGDIYRALIENHILSDIQKRGIQFVHVLGVDNILSKPAEPLLLGFAVKQHMPVTCKFVIKSSPNEAVGVFCQKNGHPSVTEYSEIKDKANLTDKQGNLLFNQANIANVLLTTQFLETIASKIDQLNDCYHLAKKEIPNYSLQEHKEVLTWGMKFELFMFDAFQFGNGMALLEATRSQEFAPIKNHDGNDSPETARKLYSEMCIGWLEKLGVHFDKESIQQGNLLEISPLVSYEGEGLEQIAKQYAGTVIKLPLELTCKIIHSA